MSARISIGQRPPSKVILSDPKLLHRVRRLDAALGLEDGHLLADVVLGGVIRDIIKGDHGMLMGSWEFADREDAARTLANLSAQWQEEDEAAANPPAEVTMKCPHCGASKVVEGHESFPEGTSFVQYPCGRRSCAKLREGVNPQCFDANGKVLEI